jgi:hypothetical protein
VSPEQVGADLQHCLVPPHPFEQLVVPHAHPVSLANGVHAGASLQLSQPPQEFLEAQPYVQLLLV